MSTLMIIQCSGNKIHGGEPLVINDPFSLPLTAARNTIMINNGMVLNNDMLKWAYQRYSGQLFTNMVWAPVFNLVNQGHLKILIVSALFGLIEFDTAIPDYDIQVSSTRQVWTLNNLLANTLNDYLTNNPDISEIQSFLSNQYYELLENTIPNNNNCWIRYSRGAQVANPHINRFINSLSLVHA